MNPRPILSTLLIPLALFCSRGIQAEQIGTIHLRALSLEHHTGDLHLGKEEAAIPILTRVYQLSPVVSVPEDTPLRFYRKHGAADEVEWEYIGEIDRQKHVGSAFTVFFIPQDADPTSAIDLRIYSDDAEELHTHQMRVINLSGQPLRAREQENIRLLPKSVPVYYHFDIENDSRQVRSRPFLTFERMNAENEWVVFTRGPLLRHAGERVTILIVESKVLQSALQINGDQGQPGKPTASLNIVSWRHQPPTPAEPTTD